MCEDIPVNCDVHSIGVSTHFVFDVCFYIRRLLQTPNATPQQTISAHTHTYKCIKAAPSSPPEYQRTRGFVIECSALMGANFVITIHFTVMHYYTGDRTWTDSYKYSMMQ